MRCIKKYRVSSCIYQDENERWLKRQKTDLESHPAGLGKFKYTYSIRQDYKIWAEGFILKLDNGWCVGVQDIFFFFFFNSDE